jgi:hypothetical protein
MDQYVCTFWFYVSERQMPQLQIPPRKSQKHPMLSTCTTLTIARNMYQPHFQASQLKTEPDRG